MKLSHAIRLARPRHWIKNLLVIIPIVFAMKMTDPLSWSLILRAAGAFCLVSSGIYIINDIFDRKRDRLHPVKSKRPIASGELPLAAAIVESVLLLFGGFAIAATVNTPLTMVIGLYLVLQLAYSAFLKTRMIVDVICIALGFVLRAVAGAVAISVEISPWLIVCTFTLCLFIGFCKRCNELATLFDAEQAENHRNTLGGYSSQLLTHLITLSAALAIMSFLLYATSARTVQYFGSVCLVYTLPLVVYGVCRFAMLSMRGRIADPTDIVFRDWPLQVTAILWVGIVVVLIQYGTEIQHWLSGR